MSKQFTKNQFIQTLDILRNEYPKWNAPIVTLIAINSNNPFKIFISTILSLRTKDQVTSTASVRLYKVADTPEDISKLSEEQLQKLIYPVGFYKNKAKQIIEICKILITKYNSKVPNSIEQLLEFKGVGRKTANLVLALGYNQDAICVDTHVHRISNRLGFVKTKNPEETEFALMKKLHQQYWNKINDLFVAFGQTICNPVKPKCYECPISFCPQHPSN